MDAIARERGLDPLDVRKANLLRTGLDQTPYGQTVEDFETQTAMIEDLEATSDYRARRERIAAFNATSPIIKRGIALTPVMFGISFTLIPLNQAGALVHVYSDGSIHLNHGGTEMGQGLFTKVAQIVAEEFGVPLHFVRITATNTAKVPNASPTAASSGTDLNGMAAKIAAGAIKQRMAAFWPSTGASHARPSSSATDLSSRATISMSSTRWPRPAVSPACSCRMPDISRPRKSTGTGPRRKAGRSTISPMAPPARKSRSTR